MIKTVIKIDGMVCSMCESHINDVIRRNFDVRKVKSDRKKKETIIESEQILNHDKIKKVIEQTGYTLVSID